MAFVIVRKLLNPSKISANTKVLLNSNFKRLHGLDVKNLSTKPFFFFSRSRDFNRLKSFEMLSSNCECACFLHTEGKMRLAKILDDIIDTNAEQVCLPEIDDFNYELNGAEVIFKKTTGDKIIAVKTSLNGSFDGISHYDCAKDESPLMRARPAFTVEIKHGEQVLSISCAYYSLLTENTKRDDGTPLRSVFEIKQMTIFEGEHTDSTYTLHKRNMEYEFYELLIDYLAEVGISNSFVDKMCEFLSHYDCKVAPKLFQEIRSGFAS